jgi:hypothetical protein
MDHERWASLPRHLKASCLVVRETNSFGCAIRIAREDKDLNEITLTLTNILTTTSITSWCKLQQWKMKCSGWGVQRDPRQVLSPYPFVYHARFHQMSPPSSPSSSHQPSAPAVVAVFAQPKTSDTVAGCCYPSWPLPTRLWKRAAVRAGSTIAAPRYAGRYTA